MLSARSRTTRAWASSRAGRSRRSAARQVSSMPELAVAPAQSRFLLAPVRHLGRSHMARSRRSPAPPPPRSGGPAPRPGRGSRSRCSPQSPKLESLASRIACSASSAETTGSDRAEDLLPPQRRVERNVGDDRRLEEGRPEVRAAAVRRASTRAPRATVRASCRSSSSTWDSRITGPMSDVRSRCPGPAAGSRPCRTSISTNRSYTGRSTITRLAATQVCPPLVNRAQIAPLAARSRSASASTMQGRSHRAPG